MKILPLGKIKAGDRLGKSIFSADGRMLLGAGQKLEPYLVRKLKEYGFSHVYVEDKDTEDIVIEDIVSEQLRRELKESLRASFTAMKREKATLSLTSIFSLLDEVIEEITRRKNLLISFMDLRASEDYLYAHSVNSCLLSLAVGSKFIQDQRKLKDLGVGALLHDAGMAHVEEKIVQKKARLTPPEKKIVQAHTELGYQMMKAREEISLLSAHIAYQHHERYDGQGYPRGLAAEQIHLYARIVAPCSVYDALTSDRPYRRRFLPDKAFTVLLSENRKAFDPEVLKAFVEKVALYPVGSHVRLSNGLEGVVARVQPGLSHRPTIKVLVDEKGRKVDSPWELDLIEEKTLFVEKVLD